MDELLRQMEHLMQGTMEVVGESDLLRKLEQKKLTVKFGMDPSAPDLHIGHAVVLRKLRQFQNYGHHVVIVIGDFTGRIGDPTGRSKVRPALTEAEVAKNALTYQNQLWRVLDRDKTEVRYNSEWLNQLRFEDVVRLCMQTTVARILERDDFANRYAAQQPIGLHEFLYPLMQGYDSVALNADVEMGGMDQRFNILMGRNMQRDAGQEAQVCMFMPLLAGLDGEMKMSKSLNNHVGLDEGAETMFKKLMRVPDHCILDYFEQATDLRPQEILAQKTRLENDVNPRDVKLDLAQEITALYYGWEEAAAQRERFLRIYSERELPREMETMAVEGMIDLPTLLVKAGWVPSINQARRMLKQGAVRWNGEKVGEEYVISDEGVLQMGKNLFLRVSVVES